MPKPSNSKEAFEALANRAGIPLTPQQKSELYEAYGYVEAMAARVRGDGKRRPDAELAVRFKPGQ